MKKDANRLKCTDLSIVFLMIIGFICVFALQTLQTELVNMSKTVETTDENFLVGKFRYFSICLRDWFHSLPPFSREVIWSLHTKYLYFIVPFVVVLEYLAPCKSEQRFAGIGFFQDVTWFVLRLVSDPILIGATIIVIKGFYDQHLSFLTIDAVLSWPLVVQILLVVMLSDFLTWVCHIANHKVSSLWVFHAVHHSQEEMNLFTGDRAHPIDTVFVQAMVSIPLFIFQVPALPAVPLVWLIRGLWQRLIHANVKLDFGVFNYILVSPQFHRIHHSKDPRHYGKNFGSFFSIWDHLFGTAYRCTTEYPATGIEDTNFPCEKGYRKSRLLLNICLQIIYPFECLLPNRINGKHKITGHFMASSPKNL